MNTQLSSRIGRSSAVSSARARFSPLLRNLTPRFPHLVSGSGRYDRLPAAVSSNALDPAIGPARIRYWDTHVVDRLSTPLTRHHD